MSHHGHGHSHPHAFRSLWGWPIALGLLTAIGLVSALFSDGGLGDIVAWITLGAVTATGLWFGWARR